MRDRLIELISQVQYMGGREAKLADYLLANGVIVQIEGEWVKHEHDFWGVYYTCSACKCDVARAKKYQFCPDCGAKMNGGAEE